MNSSDSDDDFTPDPEVAHLTPGLQKGYSVMKLRRHLYSIGGPLAPAKCQAIARSTGKQCRQIAIRGTNKCRKHGGKNTKAWQERQARKAKRRIPKKEQGRVGADQQLKIWHQQLVDEHGGAGKLMASLTEPQRRQVNNIRSTVWPHSKYQNRKGWRVLTLLCAWYVTGKIDVVKFRSFAGFIDPGTGQVFDKWGKEGFDEPLALWVPPWAGEEVETQW